MVCMGEPVHERVSLHLRYIVLLSLIAHGVYFLEALDDSIGDLLSGTLATEVRCEDGAFAHNLVNRLIEAVRSLCITQAAEHECGRADGRDGIGDVLPSDIGR